MATTTILNVCIDCSNMEISSEASLVDIFKELACKGLIGGNRMEATCYVSIDALIRISNFCRFDGVGAYCIGPYKLKIRIKDSSND